MITVISPAKKLSFDGPPVPGATPPSFPRQTTELVEVCRGLGASGIKKLMKVSDSLADLNAKRFKAMSPDFTPENAAPALYAFQGDTYVGLKADTLDEDDIAWAQDRLGILSGLYGLLRPLDLIQPYRLEMGSRLATSKGGNLYDFWGRAIGDELDKRAKASGASCLVNLASQEYFKSVDVNALSIPVISPVFKEEKDGVSKVIGIYAKRARGAMARHIIKNRITDPADLEKWNEGGYAFTGYEGERTPVFVNTSR